MHELNWVCKSLCGKKQKSCEKKGAGRLLTPGFALFLRKPENRRMPGAQVNQGLAGMLL
ncbi:hypothetical protein [Achromobacter agilis]|uniref:hypothetical protein n=1 Tax=Achromobacter agilis TaxID=1353888 RepID=UPI0013EC17FF|nr:hypothetical protein [Achromobacter agilis]